MKHKNFNTNRDRQADRHRGREREGDGDRHRGRQPDSQRDRQSYIIASEGNRNLTSCQPHKVISGQSNSVISKRTY